MSDETGTDPTPEAEATPESEGDALREALGDNYEDFMSFQESRDNWNKQQNKHNEAAATAAKEAAQARDELLKALASSREAKPDGSQEERIATPEEYAAFLGINVQQDPDAWNEPLTANQAYRAYHGMMDWALGKTSELNKEVKGVQESVSQFTERFSQSEEGFANFLATNTIDTLESKYPELDRDEMFSAIREGAEMDGDELMGFLDRRARESHERMESRLSEREKKRRTKASDKTYRGAGKASAVAGEALPHDINSPEFMKKFLQRYPSPSGGLRDEENV